MHDFEQFNGLEVHGSSVAAYAKAFQQYPSLFEKYFIKEVGIDLEDPELHTRWFPLDKWLRATHLIVQEVGSSTAYGIGKRIAEIAMMPPEVDSAAAVLTSIHAVYYLHHRCEVDATGNSAAGLSLDRIGTYRCELQDGGSAAKMTTDNPYPCDMDRGILTGFTARFEAATSVTHVGKDCRKKGDKACTYLVQW